MESGSTIKVWDIGVRLFHWSLVACFTITYLTGDDDEGSAILHTWVGYIIISLLVFRMIWGIVGGRHARFSDFTFSPATILGYMKTLLEGHPKRYLGHNPAGGLMVMVMLFSLVTVSWTGLKAYQAEGKGPLATIDSPTIAFSIPLAHADDDDEGIADRGFGEHEGDEFWEEAHETSVNIMLFLIILHLAGVVVSSLIHRENLVRAMVTGRKPMRNE